MAKWLRDYLSFGGRRPPPQPPTPDYTESDILRAYRAQKNLDFEDPYEDAESRLEPDPAGPGDSKNPGDAKYGSPKHRLIKVEAADMARAKALLGGPGEEQFDSPEWERTPGSAKELRRPPPRSPQPAERVDPALPLEKQPSSQGFLHLKFARTRENQVVLGQHSGPFPSVPELVLHYSSRPLPVQGAEHLALLYPVVMQTP
uniref:Src homology 2 domain containing transforming protein D n=1 Tax=Rhinopithecus bieti TaxID=61621 RepID=A0A2K6MLY1_RHIBE